MKFSIGQRVYYKDRGPSDVGTIIDIEPEDDHPYVVKWDNSANADEVVDQFSENQLEHENNVRGNI
jgi:hypothetical protein